MRFIITPEYRVSIAMRCNLHHANPNEVKTRERGGLPLLSQKSVMSFIDPLKLQDTNDLVTCRRIDQKVSETSSMEITILHSPNEMATQGKAFTFLCCYEFIFKNQQVSKLIKTEWLVSTRPITSKPVPTSMLSKSGSILKWSLQRS